MNNQPVSEQTIESMSTINGFIVREDMIAAPESNALWFAETNEVFTALAAQNFNREVLELAPGTGIWPDDLAARCQRAGLTVIVKETQTFFIYGYGTKKR